MIESMHAVTLGHFLMTGAILFVLGLIGFVTRRNLIIMFLCTEMMFQGVAITLIAFSKFHMNMSGQTFVIFLLTVAAAESAMALGLVVLLFRRKRSLDSQVWAQMAG